MEDCAKPRDLEDRTFRFAESIRIFVKQLPRTISNVEDVRQLVRASGSVAPNWIEADEALSKIDAATNSSAIARDNLATEARELVLIFSSIISKNQ
jgi:four helix bundle protein